MERMFHLQQNPNNSVVIKTDTNSKDKPSYTTESDPCLQMLLIKQARYEQEKRVLMQARGEQEKQLPKTSKLSWLQALPHKTASFQMLCVM